MEKILLINFSSAIVRNSEPGRERQDYGVDWWDFTEPIVSVDFGLNDNRSVIIFRTLLPGIELRRLLSDEFPEASKASR